MRPVTVLALLASICSAQSARVLTRENETPFILKLGGLSPPRPVWSGWALLTFEIPESRELVLQATTPDGRNEEIRFSDPDWSVLTAISVRGGTDGEIVLTGHGRMETGDTPGFIGWVGVNRKDQHTVRIDGYAPQVMTVGPGGIIWMVATQIRPKPLPAIANVLLRFSPDGKLLTSTYLQVKGVGPLDIDGVPTSSTDVAKQSSLAASTDRVAWLTAKNQYLEWDSSGTEITHLDGPAAGNSNNGWGKTVSITAANTVLIGVGNRDPRARLNTQDLWALDRINKKWLKSELANGALAFGTQIYGFDGNDLMTSGVSPQLGTLLVRYRLSETR